MSHYLGWNQLITMRVRGGTTLGDDCDDTVECIEGSQSKVIFGTTFVLEFRPERKELSKQTI